MVEVGPDVKTLNGEDLNSVSSFDNKSDIIYKPYKLTFPVFSTQT